MPEVDVWRALSEELVAGAPCAVLAVADARGSAPGRIGAVMAVGPAGPIAGTIGGGAVESGLVDQVRSELAAGAVAARVVEFQHRRGAPNASGMICGGAQRVVVASTHPGDVPGVQRVVDALSAGRQVDWCADPGGWRVISEGLGPEPGLVGLGRHWSYYHRSGPTHGVHVIGAGHVGAALAALLVGLDFRVLVIDERESLDLTGVAAHERLRLDYSDLARVVSSGRTSLAVIMTHSHERDAAALNALLGVDLGYLGLLGSRAKARHLVAGRAMPEWFRSPIGLPIGSQTPAEIAVSVAAELVAVRSAAKAGRR